MTSRHYNGALERNVSLNVCTLLAWARRVFSFPGFMFISCLGDKDIVSMLFHFLLAQ